MPGYNPDFFAGSRILLPRLTAAQKRQRVPLTEQPKSYELTYTHFSIVLNKKRRFAFFTGCNIDGEQWQALEENNDRFAFEKRLAKEHQTGDELYGLHSGTGINDFDKGHIVKFQDPQWGTKAVITKAAKDTMTFANCVPQHQSLNRGAWKSLEDYIVKKFTPDSGADGKKVTVFAGPMLLDTDPFYIDLVEGKPFQVPVHFWKVVVYRNQEEVLSAVAFLMSQKAVLLRHNFVVEKKDDVRPELRVAKIDFFSDFKKGEPYQVTLNFIERMTGFSFGLNNLYQPYTKEEPTEVIFKRVEIPVKTRAFKNLPFAERPLHFTFDKISL